MHTHGPPSVRRPSLPGSVSTAGAGSRCPKWSRQSPRGSARNKRQRSALEAGIAARERRGGSARGGSSARHVSFHVGPELFSEIAKQIEADRHGTLDGPEPRGVQTIRVPLIREKRRPVGAAEPPRRERLAAGVGAGQD